MVSTSPRRWTTSKSSTHRHNEGRGVCSGPKEKYMRNSIPESYQNARLTASWRYLDSDGEPVAMVGRYDGDGSKQVIPFTLDGGGWRMGAPDALRPLFGLNTLPGDRQSRVFVCEGEKCAAALHALGMPGMTSMGGSNAVFKADWQPLADFEHLVLLPDADEPGEKYMQDVARALARLPGSRRVEIARLPNLPKHGDVVDWLQAQPELENWDGYAMPPGVDVADLRAGLLATAKEIAEPVRVADVRAQAPMTFEAFNPLPNDLPNVLTLPAEMLPEALRPWLLDVSERIGCPVDFPAAAAAVVAGSLIGRQVGIRPTRNDDWTVVPNLWGAVIGRPGTLKSPALAEATKPLGRLEAQAREQFEQEMAAFEATKVLSDSRRKAAKKQVDKLITAGDEGAARAVLEKLDTGDEEPVLRRYSTQDSTIEKLGELLQANPNGLLVWRDELTGWLRSLEREGRESDRSFYLESWDGRGSFTCDRIGRGTTYIPHAVLSVFGSIQPGPLRAYLAQNSEGAGADGLLQRFQVAVWPDVTGSWRQVDRWPDKTARDTAYAALESLAHLDSTSIGAQTDEYDPLPYLRFDAEAQTLFDSWRADLEARLRSGDEPESFEAVLAKYRSLVPSLALIFHLVDGRCGHVAYEHLEMALCWIEYLESHARRIYSTALDADTYAARLLWQRLEKGELEAPFTARDLKRKHWAGLQDKKADGALKVLELHGYLARERQDTGGRPTAVWHVNPEALGQAPEAPAMEPEPEPEQAPAAAPEQAPVSPPAASDDTSRPEPVREPDDWDDLWGDE